MLKLQKISNMKILVTSLLLACLLFFSLKFEKLNERNANNNQKLDYSKKIENLIKKGIVENSKKSTIEKIINEINSHSDAFYQEFGHRLGIGASAYFIIHDQATIQDIQDGILQLSNGSSIDTKYIFGNEIRDASNFISLTEFDSQVKLNQFTSELNASLRKKFKNPPFNIGDKIQFIGAAQVYKDRLPLESLHIIPVKIEKI